MMRNVAGPYDFQRLRHRLGEYPRPPQPAIQPNQLPAIRGWGMGTQEYWANVFSDYLKRRKDVGKLTNLGGLK